MARGFNIVAELQIHGPTNLNQISSNIQNALNSKIFNVNVITNPASINRLRTSISRGLSIDPFSINVKVSNSSLQQAIRTIGQTLGSLQNRGINVAVNVTTRGLTQNSLNRLTQLDQIARRLTVSLRGAAISGSAFQSVLTNLGSLFAGNVNNATLLANAISNITRSLNTVRQHTQQANTSIEGFGRQSQLAIKRFLAFSIPTSIFLGLGAAFAKGTKDAIEFQDVVVKLSQITGQSVSSLEKLADVVTKLSTSFGVSSKELIDGAETLAQAGLSEKDTRIALETLAKTQLAPTFTDAKNTIEGMIAAMAQFKIPATDLEKEFGAINAVAAAFAVESDDIITAIRRTGGAFKAAGGDLRELSALFTSVRSTTRESAETIATGFRTIFTRLQRAGTIEFLKTLGIDLVDTKGKFVGAFEAVNRLSSALGNLAGSGDIRFSQVIEELGGFRQVEKVIPLLTQFSVAQRALAVAEGGVGSLARDAETRQQSLAVQLRKVKEEFLDLFRTISNNQSFKAFITLVTEAATQLIRLSKAGTAALPFLAAGASIPLVTGAARFGAGFLGIGRDRTQINNRNQPPPPNTGFPATLLSGLVTAGLITAINSRLDSRLENIDKTKNERDFKNVRGTQGAVSGFGIGAFLGLQSGLGLPGIVGGAAIGGIAGFLSSVSDAAEAIRQTKIDLALNNVSTALNEFAAGTRTIAGTNLIDFQKSLEESTKTILSESLKPSPNENNSLLRFNRSLSFSNEPTLIERLVGTTSSEEKSRGLTKTLGAASQDIPNLRSLSERILRDIISTGNITDKSKANDVFSKFTLNNGGLGNTIINRLGLISQTGTKDISEQFKKAIPTLIEENKNRENLLKTFKEFNDAQLKANQEINRFSGAIISAANSVQKLETNITLLESFLGNGTQSPKIAGTSDIIKNFDKIDAASFNEAIKTFSFITGDAGKELAGIASEAKRAIDIVPGIFKTIAGKSLNERGSLQAELGSELQKAGFNPNGPVTAAIKNTLGELANNTNEVQAIDKIRDDLQEVLGKLNEGLKQFIEPIDEINKEFISKVNELNQGMTKVVSSVLQTDKEFERLQSLIVQNETLSAKLNERPVNPNVLTAQFSNTQKFLAGDIGLNPQALLNRINSLEQDITRTEERRQSLKEGGLGGFTTTEINATEAKLAELRIQFGRAKDALQNLTDVTKRTAGLEEKRSQLANRRQTFGNFVEDFIFGNNGQKFDALKNLNSTNVALKFGLQSVPQANLGGVRSVLKTFGDVQLPGFGNQTGNQALKELVFQQLKPVGQKLGLGENQIRELAGQLTQDEKDTINKIVEASTAAIEAQKLLLNKQGELQNKLFEGLQKSFDAFLIKFGQTQLENQNRNIKQGIGGLTEEKAGLVKNRQTITDVATKFGLPINNFTDITNLGKSETIGTIEKLKDVLKQIDLVKTLRDDKTIISGNKFGGANIETVIDKLFNTGLKKENFKDFDKLLGELTAIFGDSKIKTDVERNKAINTAIEDNLKFNLDRSTLENKKIDLRETLKTLVGANSKSFDIAQNAARGGPDLDQIKQLGEALGSFTNIDQITAKIDELTLKIKTLGATADAVQNQIGNVKGAPVVPVQKAFGGSVYGKPGIDKVPAYLTSGEFVVKKDAAEKNRALLNSINNGGPLHFANGGRVPQRPLTPFELDRLLNRRERQRRANVNLGNFRQLFPNRLFGNQGIPQPNKKLDPDNPLAELENLQKHFDDSLPINLKHLSVLEDLANHGDKNAIKVLENRKKNAINIVEKNLKHGVSENVFDDLVSRQLEIDDTKNIETRNRIILRKALAARNRLPKSERKHNFELNTIISDAQRELEKINEARKRDIAANSIFNKPKNGLPEFIERNPQFGPPKQDNPIIPTEKPTVSVSPKPRERVLPHEDMFGGPKNGLPEFLRDFKPDENPVGNNQLIVPKPQTRIEPLQNQDLEGNKVFDLDPEVKERARRLDLIRRSKELLQRIEDKRNSSFDREFIRRFNERRGFNKGGIVPGVGNTDSVPAFLTPGEAVIPKKIVQRFQNGGIVGENKGGFNNFGFENFTQAISNLARFGTEFHTNINIFGNFINKFGEFVNKIPSEITMTGNHNLNVIINGAEAINSLQSSLKDLVTGEINKSINNLIRTKFPEKLVSS